MDFIGMYEGEPEDFWPMHMDIEAARFGQGEDGCPWVVVLFALGNDVLRIPWYRAHCLN